MLYTDSYIIQRRKPMRHRKERCLLHIQEGVTERSICVSYQQDYK